MISQETARYMFRALQGARLFIINGVEYGYIVMPDKETVDSAHDTLPMIETALKKAILDSDK